MTDDDRHRLISQLQQHEGFRRFAYRDSLGFWTIGYGFCIDERVFGAGLPKEIAEPWQVRKVDEADRECRRAFTWFADLDSVRQAALVNICYNLGLTKLLGFEKALRAMAAGGYDRAADEFFDSKWATQVGQRAVELCEQIRTGAWA